MIETIVLFLATLASLSIIAIGLRRGVLSPLTVFGAHVLLGVSVRFAVVANAQSPGGFYGVLTRAVGLDPARLLFELFLCQLLVLVSYAAYRGAASAKVATLVSRTLSVKASEVPLAVAVGIFFIGWTIFAVVVVRQFGSIGAAFFTLQKRAILFGSDVVIARAMLVVGFGALTMVAVRCSAGMAAGRKGYKLLLLLLSALHLALMFQLGGRGATLTHALVLLFVVWSAGSRTLPRLTIKSLIVSALSVPVMVAVILVGMAVRVSAQTGIPVGSALSAVASTAPEQLSATFSVYDLYAAARSFSDITGFSYGENYLSFLSRFVPRVIWEDKPLIVGLQLREFYYHDRLSGVPPTIFGEGYVAFGLTGALLASLILGLLLGVLSRLQEALPRRPELAGLYMFALLQIAVGSVKSGFENSIFSLLYFILGVLLVRAFRSRARPRLARSRPSGLAH